MLPISIGRDAACTIALEDPNKHMSRFHVEIQQGDGAYWMAVVSKVNPVMVKGRRYGPGARVTLQSGDSFELAEYQVQVLLAEPEAAEPETATPVDPQLHGTATQIGRADEAERLFNEATFLGDRAPARKAAPPPPPSAPPLPPESTFIAQKPAMAPGAPAGHPLRAFFEGAGLPHKPLSPMETDRILRECGGILRAAIEGLMKLLRTRTEMRKSLGADERALAVAGDNNPLKLMSDAQHAMDFLFDAGERTDGLLDPVQAVGDACEDLRAHELAVMAGMRAALLAALRRLDPPVIERVADQNAKSLSLAGRKGKLWDAFVVEQDKLAREAQDHFSKAFGRDFIGAYQAELRRLKGGR